MNPGNRPDCRYWLQVYNSDVIVKKPVLQANTADRGKRGNIFQFSKESQRRLLFVCRNSGHHIRSQYCCTYHNSWPINGRIVKKDLRKFKKRIERRFGRRTLYYLWCLEFQERGAPHIHFYSSIDPTAENHMALAQMWLEVIGETENRECRSFNEHPKNFFAWEMKNGAYLAKEYIAKSVQKEIPEAFHSVGRFWGHSNNMKPDFLTVDPLDQDQAYQDLYHQAVRIVTSAYEKKRDSFKTFGVLFAEKLALIGLPPEEIHGSMKRQISIGIKLSKAHKTHRRRPATNIRKKAHSYSLPGMSQAYYRVLQYLNPHRQPEGSFLRFSRFADGKDAQPLAQPQPGPKP